MILRLFKKNYGQQKCFLIKSGSQIFFFEENFPQVVKKYRPMQKSKQFQNKRFNTYVLFCGSYVIITSWINFILKNRPCSSFKDVYMQFSQFSSKQFQNKLVLIFIDRSNISFYIVPEIYFYFPLNTRLFNLVKILCLNQFLKISFLNCLFSQKIKEIIFMFV